MKWRLSDIVDQSHFGSTEVAGEVKVLKKLFEVGYLDDEDAKVRGIAKRAIAHGYNTLTEPQKHVLSSWLTRQCDGHTDPAGELHECHVILEGEALANALENEGYYGRGMCQSCIDEVEEYDRQWDKMNDE
ncbi:hypothetical protein ACNFIC_18200 [Pseudomonas sp. NY15463]|uniref:hypothetical protein n=1 Tax=Pseudomonas sp. NY15463 TaxID=3400361 RepID=UPI003A848332